MANCSYTGLGVIEPNPEFEVDKISEYMDISNWCHHVHYLLPQGRTVWWNPIQKADDEFEEEEDDNDEKEQPEEPEPEDGPPLLTSAAEDASEWGGGGATFTAEPPIKGLPLR